MKKYCVLLSFLIYLSPAYAGTLTCGGKVKLLMADHTSCRDSAGEMKLAFQLEGIDPWKCVESDAAASLVLAAKMTDQSILTYIDDFGGATCQTHTQYLKPKFIILD